MLSKNELKVGDKLTATSPCKMYREEINALTIGKKYEIMMFEEEDNEDYILIIDDQNEKHLYPVNELEKWFDASKFSSFTI
jgi:hypothetical protein